MKKEISSNSENKYVGNWLKAPTVIELLISFFLLGIIVAIATDAVVSLSYIKLVYFSILIIATVVIVRVGLFILTIRVKPKSKYYFRWVSLGFATVIMVIITTTNLDLSLRVWLSRKSLEKEVQFVQSLSPNDQKRVLRLEPKSVALFNLRLYEVDNETGTIWFQTAYGRDVFPPPYSLLGGIVYKKQGEPPERGETTYQHLYGPWWRWLQDI